MVSLFLINPYIRLLNRARTPFTIKTSENRRIASNPIKVVIGAKGAKNVPVNGTCKRAKPAKIHAKYNKLNFSIFLPPLYNIYVYKR